jgi:hypothetical protein
MITKCTECGSERTEKPCEICAALDSSPESPQVWSPELISSRQRVQETLRRYRHSTVSKVSGTAGMPRK